MTTGRWTVGWLRRPLAVLGCVWLGCMLVVGAQAAQAGVCQDPAEVPWRSLAPGVWVWAAPAPAEVSPENGGHVMPTTVVLDGDRALVIDPGPSHRHGLRLKASLACRFGARVTDLVNTHAHSENVLANSAFSTEVAQGAVRIWALAATRETMALRCPACLESLTQHAGAEAMAGTEIVLPTDTLEPGQPLVWGPFRFEVQALAQAHTGSDLLLWWPQRQLLWAGGLVYEDRVPELAQGSLEGWLGALDAITRLRPATVVGVAVSVAPQPGAVPTGVVQTQAYLRALRQGVWAAMDTGESPNGAHLVPLPDHAAWVGYTQRHGFNVLRAWRELEPQWMATPPAAPR